MNKIFKIFAVPGLLFLFGVNISAQKSGETGSSESEFSHIFSDNTEILSERLYKPYINYNLGTSYSWLGNGTSWMNYYFAPQLTLPVSKKLSFHGGVMASVYTPMVLNQTENSQSSAAMSVFSVYGAASYQVNENLTFYTSGVKHLSGFPYNSPFSYKPSDYFSIGSSLRLGNNVTIGASLHVRENNGFSSSPYMPGQGRHNPFLW